MKLRELLEVIPQTTRIRIRRGYGQKDLYGPRWQFLDSTGLTEPICDLELFEHGIKYVSTDVLNDECIVIAVKE